MLQGLLDGSSLERGHPKPIELWHSFRYNARERERIDGYSIAYRVEDMQKRAGLYAQTFMLELGARFNQKVQRASPGPPDPHPHPTPNAAPYTPPPYNPTPYTPPTYSSRPLQLPSLQVPPQAPPPS